MSREEYVVFFRDGSSVVVRASGYFDAKAQARKVFPRKRVSSVQRARPVYG